MKNMIEEVNAEVNNATEKLALIINEHADFKESDYKQQVHSQVLQV